MLARRFVFVAALVALSGCDLAGGPDPVGAAVVTEVTVLSAPLREPDGHRWDGGLIPSDADLFIVIAREVGGNMVYSRNALGGGGVLDNVVAASLPFTYRPTSLGGTVGTVPNRNLTERLTVELRDADFGGSELMATLGPFTLSQYAPATAGSTTSFTLTREDGSASARITVRWEP